MIAPSRSACSSRNLLDSYFSLAGAGVPNMEFAAKQNVRVRIEAGVAPWTQLTQRHVKKFHEKFALRC
jgi:hypothetical protein